MAPGAGRLWKCIHYDVRQEAQVWKCTWTGHVPTELRGFASHTDDISLLTDKAWVLGASQPPAITAWAATAKHEPGGQILWQPWHAIGIFWLP